MVDKTVNKQTDDEKVRQAKIAFLLGVGDMSWRLASVFMLPVIVGYVIDQVNDSDRWVIYGTILGFILSILFIIKLGLEANKK